MKNIFTIILVIVSLSANALSYVIVGSSFDETTPIEQGSQQYIDVKSVGSNSTSDSMKVYIRHINDNNTLSNTVYLIRVAYYKYFPGLPSNPDGSKRVYFTIPENYTEGKFQINLLNAIENPKGIISAPSGVMDAISQEGKTIIGMCDLNGKTLIYPTGIYIVLFSDGTRKKVLSDY